LFIFLKIQFLWSAADTFHWPGAAAQQRLTSPRHQVLDRSGDGERRAQTRSPTRPGAPIRAARALREGRS
jgi:hypothetical protein